jgi:microsomal dipeptidase-like Zn-dependent dipeptidase
MNQLGVAIDLSHVGERTTLDAIEASECALVVKAVFHVSLRTVHDIRSL